MKFQLRAYQTVRISQEIEVTIDRKELINTLYDVLDSLVREELDLMTDAELMDYAENALNHYYMDVEFEDLLIDFADRSMSEDEDRIDHSSIEVSLIR